MNLQLKKFKPEGMTDDRVCVCSSGNVTPVSPRW